MSVPPLPSESPAFKDIPPAVSALQLQDNYWDVPNSSSSPSSLPQHPVSAPSSPQVCFFVGSQDESFGDAEQ